MKVDNKLLKYDTEKRFQIMDITDDVRDFLQRVRAQNGQVLVFSKHTTLAIVVNEKESGIFKDAKEFFSRLVPDHNYYHHNDMNIRTENLVCDSNSECRNGDSHLAHFLLGASETIPVVSGKMQFGPWQRILAVELDGPRKERAIHLEFIGE